MPLQGSGAISISQIRTELINVNASYSLRTLSAAAGKSIPDAMSEFYGYSSFPPYGTFYTSYCEGYSLIYAYHNGSGGYYYLFTDLSTDCGCTDPNIIAGATYTTVCACNWGTLNINIGIRDYWADSAAYFCSTYPGSGLYVKRYGFCDPSPDNITLETGTYIPNYC